MKITLKDGSVKEFEAGLSVLDIAKSISEGLARNACCGIINGKVVMKDRVLVNIDEELIYRKSRKVAEKLWKRL